MLTMMGSLVRKNSFRYEEAMLRRFLVVLTTLGLLVGASPIAQGQPANRKISERVLRLAESKKLICDEEPYCYLFKAIVDIDSGHLRVWATDEMGTDYVLKKLYAGETVYVRQVFIYKGVKRAQLSVMRDGCMVVSCSGSVDLRYLR
jgi:hypothetical protein